MAFPVRATNRAILPVLWRTPDTIDDARLTARLEQAWRMKAGRRAIAALDAARAGQS